MQVQRHVYENKQNICLASLLEHTFSSALFATVAFWLRSEAMTQTAKVPSLQQAHDDSPPEKQEDIIDLGGNCLKASRIRSITISIRFSLATWRSMTMFMWCNLPSSITIWCQIVRGDGGPPATRVASATPLCDILSQQIIQT